MLALTYGQKIVPYRLVRSARRTIEIAVHPDGSIVVRAPQRASQSEIQKRVDEKARWIFAKLDHFKQFHPMTPKRNYVSGETHLYLGRQYRLRVGSGDTNTVKLSRGFLTVTLKGVHNDQELFQENQNREGLSRQSECTGLDFSDGAQSISECESASEYSGVVKALLTQWYLQRARIVFTESLARCFAHFDYPESDRPTLRIRRMKTRWGSLSGKGNVTMNADLIRAPMECIDYVMMHELCHIAHRNHAAGFYALLERKVPRWKDLKARLNTALR